MKPIVAVACGLSALFMAAPGVTAEESRPWLHVQVQEAKGAQVHVNVPLSLVEIALKAAPQPIVHEGQIHIGRHDGKAIKIADLRNMWEELKAAGDNEFVSVKDDEEGETVTVSRAGSLVLVRVQGDKKGESVKVDVPIAFVDALFSGEGDELDVHAAIKELSKTRGDVVHVQDKEDSVRIWVDEGR
jgi:hypothetical protein